MFEFKMPSMGADMENGILVQWNYAVGDHVEKGEIICEIETAKGNIDVEIWESGTITKLLVEPGAKIPVGDVMAVLDTGERGATSEEPVAEETVEEEPVAEETVAEESVAEESVAEESVAEESVEEETVAEETVAEETVAEETVEPEAATEDDDKGRQAVLGTTVAASPAARRRATELGVALDQVSGSGPDGAIKLEDVEGFKPSAGTHHRVTPVARRMARDSGVDTDAVEATGSHDKVTKADIERELAGRKSAGPAAPSDPQSALRDAIARAMARSKREIPHYYLQTETDVTATLQWMNEVNESRSVKERLVFGALVARAVALAAAEVPEMNGFFEDASFHPAEAVHVGFAVAMRGGGVVAPAIHDTDQKSLDETMTAIKDVVRRVRGGKLRSSEMTDPTITVTNLGDLGVDTVFGIIYPPQVAIVGVGSPRDIPVATEGMVGVRTCVQLTLSGDHRVSDGLVGAKFLQSISQHLNNPEEL